MFRNLASWAVYISSTAVLGIVAIFISLFDDSGDKAHLVARLWGRIQLRTSRVGVKVDGLEKFDPKRTYILVCNHRSYVDIFACLGYLPIQFRWIAKAQLFRVPFLGWAMSRIGYIPIERGSPKKAYRSMLEAAERVKNGVSVLIFPEGTRSPDGRLQPFKKGMFLIALKSKAPILPITLLGTAEILPKGKWFARPGNVRIIIDPPIETAEFPADKENELSERVRQTLMNHLKS